jgi:hypothetical protein
VNNLLSIAQQLYVTRKIEKEFAEKTAKNAQNKAISKKGNPNNHTPSRIKTIPIKVKVNPKNMAGPFNTFPVLLSIIKIMVFSGKDIA